METMRALVSTNVSERVDACTQLVPNGIPPLKALLHAMSDP